MGRSVSTHKYSIAVCYEDVSSHGYSPEFDDNGDEIYSDKQDWTYDEFCHQVDWDNWVDHQRYLAEQVFPSMTKCDKFLDDEDLAIMENDHAYIGVSEYCGCASIWLVCKADVMDIDHDGLARAWCNRASLKFTETFGNMVKLGTFSNGVTVYEPKGG